MYFYISYIHIYTYIICDYIALYILHVYIYAYYVFFGILYVHIFVMYPIQYAYGFHVVKGIYEQHAMATPPLVSIDLQSLSGTENILCALSLTYTTYT